MATHVITGIPPRPMPGGPLAIDLVNTTWDPGTGPVDWLVGDAEIRAFARDYGHDLSVAAVAETRHSLERARRTIEAVFSSPTELDDDLIVEVDQWLAPARVTFAPDGAGLEITGGDTVESLAVEAIVDAVELRAGHRDRIRRCEGQPCTLWFIDTSKAGRRRWCSMQRCGNRAKARRYYARSTAESAVPPPPKSPGIGREVATLEQP